MAAGDGERDSVEKRLNRTRGWVEKVEGKVTRLGARGNRAERRGIARGVQAMSSARVGLGVRAKKEKGMEERRSFPCSQRIRATRMEGEVRRDGRHVASPRLPVCQHGRVQGRTGDHNDCFD